MKYVYPAIFTEENKNSYLVNFPDIEGCFTDGNTLEDALENAKDVLNLKLWYMEDKKFDIKPATNPKKIKTKKNEFVTLIGADTTAYRALYDKKSVKKTLSIPHWLDILATEHNINFSNVLQNALKNQLGVDTPYKK